VHEKGLEKIIWGGIFFIIALSVGVLIYLGMTSWEGVDKFEQYMNKEVLTPREYDEYRLRDGESFNFSSLYIDHPYTRKVVLMQDEIDALYKKKIDWSTGALTNEEYKELQDLLEYHLNKSNNNIVTVATPKTGDLKELKESTVYRVTDKGVLVLNQFVKEYDQDDNMIKSYVYQFRLSYNIDNGMVEIN
jgi:hypothetical protein